MIAAGVPVAEFLGANVVSDTVRSPLGVDGTGPEAVVVRHDVPELEFVRPLPGFPDLTRFVLVRLDGVDPGADPGADLEVDEGDADPVVYELRSVEQPEVRFLVAVPTAFFADYDFELDESDRAQLGLEEAGEALVLVVLTIGDNAASMTANLLAPVVINARNRSAAQVILSGTQWPVRAAVV